MENPSEESIRNPDRSVLSHLAFHLIRWPVHQIQSFRGPGKGRVQPTDIIGRKHVFRHVTLIYEDPLPLSALRLMASHGIGIFHLQGIEIRVGFQLLQPFTPHRNVHIIRFYGKEQGIGLGFRQGRCFAL